MCSRLSGYKWVGEGDLALKLLQHRRQSTFDPLDNMGPIPETIRSWSTQIRSHDPGQSHSTDADHDRLIRSRKYETKQKKQKSLLLIESWHISFIGKFRIEITWSWLNEKHQTDDIYSWRHSGRCGDVIFECRYESDMASSVQAHSVCSWYNTVWTCHIWQVYVCD